MHLQKWLRPEVPDVWKGHQLMERHPLIFLALLVLLGIMLGTIIGMQLIAQRRQIQHGRTLRAVHNDLDELANDGSRDDQLQ